MNNLTIGENSFKSIFTDHHCSAIDVMNILKTANEAAGGPILTVDEFRSLFGYPPLNKSASVSKLAKNP